LPNKEIITNNEEITKMKPYLESEPDRYCRLFPPSQSPVRPEGLVKLGSAMIDNGGDVSNPPPPDEYLADAGYTYFGQFLDHELTQMDPLVDPVKNLAEDVENRQTPPLDLSHLYGGGPAKEPQLYEEDGARLRVGRSGNGHSFDVYVDPKNHQPVLADSRSRENIMLRQMVAVFARLHNAAVKQVITFEEARSWVTWQFQYLVVEDYLRRLLDASVYKKVFVKKDFHFEWKKFSIPIEFAVAAMRHGHSMVRSNYLFPGENDQSLKSILDRSNKKGELEDSWRIAWGLFFQGAGGSGFTMTSRPIDTLVSKPLHDLSRLTLQLFTVSKMRVVPDRVRIALPVLTLLRGEKFQLPSGQNVANEFGVKELTTAELLRPRGKTAPQGPILEEYELLTKTPLWYYILKESEVRSNGSYLGSVGSHVMAETIAAALRYDPNSYWNTAPPRGTWPLPWQIGGTTVRIYTLMELFFYSSLF
jgi:Animal haem peroxidase